MNDPLQMLSTAQHDPIIVKLNEGATHLTNGVPLNTHHIQLMLKDPHSVLNKSAAGYVTYVAYEEAAAKIQKELQRLAALKEADAYYLALEKSRASNRFLTKEEINDHQKIHKTLDQSAQQTQRLLDALKVEEQALNKLYKDHTTYLTTTVPQQWQALRTAQVGRLVPQLNKILASMSQPPLRDEEIQFLIDGPNLTQTLITQPDFFTNVLGMEPDQITYESVERHKTIADSLKAGVVLQARKQRISPQEVDTLAGNKGDNILTDKAVYNPLNTVLAETLGINRAEERALFLEQLQEKQKFTQRFEATAASHQTLQQQLPTHLQKTQQQFDQIIPQFKPQYLLVGDVPSLLRELELLGRQQTPSPAHPRQRINAPESNIPAPPSPPNTKPDWIALQFKMSSEVKKLNEAEQQTLLQKMTRDTKGLQPGWENQPKYAPLAALMLVCNEITPHTARTPEEPTSSIKTPSPFRTSLKPHGG